MVSGLWRRIQSALGTAEPRQAGRRTPVPVEPESPRPRLPDLPLHQKAEAAPEPRLAPAPEPAAGSDTVATPLPAEEGKEESPEQFAERLSTRLVEDETLRGSLSDEEFQPLLDWALGRVGELARSGSTLPPAAAPARLRKAESQVLELLRLADLAIGERAEADPGLVVSRFQMLDTLLAPPLLEQDAAGRARARLEALLAEPPERLQAAEGAELARRVAEALG